MVLIHGKQYKFDAKSIASLAKEELKRDEPAMKKKGPSQMYGKPTSKLDALSMKTSSRPAVKSGYVKPMKKVSTVKKPGVKKGVHSSGWFKHD